MEVMQRELICCFTVDTDADQFFGNALAHKNPRDKSIPGWDGLERGKDVLMRALDAAARHIGLPIPITWFVRCDGQIAEIHGAAEYLLLKHRSWWRARQAAGDDIQWHAHLNRRDGSAWIQRTDIMGLRSDLSIGLAAFQAEGLRPIAVRIGEAYHSAELMGVLQEMGLRADCTAMPGRQRIDNEKNINWIGTPNRPYHPSAADHRVENNADALSIWEIPMNTISTQVSYDEHPLLRYINPAFCPGVLDKGLTDFVKAARVLVSIMHPVEVLPDFFADSRLKKHPLLAFDPLVIAENLQFLLWAANQTSRNLRFITMSELINLLDEENE
jgi:hypothetical protein